MSPSNPDVGEHQCREGKDNAEKRPEVKVEHQDHYEHNQGHEKLQIVLHVAVDLAVKNGIPCVVMRNAGYPSAISWISAVISS